MIHSRFLLALSVELLKNSSMANPKLTPINKGRGTAQYSRQENTPETNRPTKLVVTPLKSKSTDKNTYLHIQNRYGWFCRIIRRGKSKKRSRAMEPLKPFPITW